MALLSQINIVTAAKKAGVKRFVPCGFATVCPAGGVMVLRDQVTSLPRTPQSIADPKVERTNPQPHKTALSSYTFIDVGYWYQLSVPRLPSGRIDKYIFPDMNTVLHVDGEAPNLLTDLRDIGRFVARIVGMRGR